MSTRISLTNAEDGFAFGAVHGVPEGESRGGIILLQEIFGLDCFMDADIARWVDAGYEVVAPSLFDRSERGFVAAHDPDGIARGLEMFGKTGFETPIGDIRACLGFLAPRGPVFIVGYCYGGSLAWLSAVRIVGITAVACYYGNSIADFATEAPRCPAICHFGQLDPHIPAEATRDRILALQPDVPVHIYARSGHGFNNAGLPDCDADDAAIARRRTIELFDAQRAQRA